MKQLRKDILKEAMAVCKQSSLFHVFSPKEKREALIHVYNVIHETRDVKREASRRSA